MNAPTLFSANCDNCFSPFATLSPRARFCCERCKNEHWRKVYKRFALVELFMTVYQLAESARRWVMLAIAKAEAKCCEVARMLGYKYCAKKRAYVPCQEREFLWVKG